MSGKFNFKFLIVLVPIVWFILWFGIFQSMLSPTQNLQGGHDELSDTEITKEDAIRSESSNPHLPYFIGFKELSKRGVSQDDRAYINDVIINYVLYKKGVNQAKISYVKDSYKAIDYEISLKSLKTIYEFKFGINNGDIHTVRVTSDAFKKKISVDIYKDSKDPLYSKKFTIISR